MAMAIARCPASERMTEPLSLFSRRIPLEGYAVNTRPTLRQDTEPIAGPGRPKGNVGTTNIPEREHDATYVLARLKRDDPDQ